MKTVFWSWQSDLPARETRSLIREAIVLAIDSLVVDFDEANRPEIDHETKGVAGSPEIVATILSKIDSAAVFVCDVTPIVVTKSGKHIPNPNVAIELGYAKKSLTPDRVICVWNTAITGASVEDLTFDMRHRRAPIDYSLPIGSSKAELRECRDALMPKLRDAISASLAIAQSKPLLSLPWQATDFTHQSIWKGAESPLIVNRSGDDPISVSFDGQPRAFARFIANTYSPVDNPFQILEGSTSHPVPLGRYSSLSWGRTSGGFLAFRHIGNLDQTGFTPTGTRWFSSTGEFWGVDSHTFSEHNGETIFSWGYMIERWVAWLKHNLTVATAVGGRAPFHVQIGLSGILGTVWAKNPGAYGSKKVAVENYVHSIFKLDSSDKQEIVEAVYKAFEQVTFAYGLDPLPRAVFVKEL